MGSQAVTSRGRARILEARLGAKAEAPFSNWPSDTSTDPLDATDVAWLVSHGKKDLRGALLNDLDLRNLALEGIVLVGANLRRTLLSRLTRCYLEGAHLEGADLVQGRMRRCRCKGIRLDRACLDVATLDD